MRAALAVALALISGPAAAECTPPDDVVAWMKLEWWGNSHARYEAGPDTAAIANGISSISGSRLSPESLYIVFVSTDKSAARIAVFSAGCYMGRIDVPAEMVATWLERSRS